MRNVHNTTCREKAKRITYFVCVRACVRVSEPGRVGVYVRGCSLVHPACNAYAPYCEAIRGPSVFTIIFDIVS